MHCVGVREWLRPWCVIGLGWKDYAQVERDVGAWLRRTTSEIPHDDYNN
jgi:hypothetical protein